VPSCSGACRSSPCPSSARLQHKTTLSALADLENEEKKGWRRGMLRGSLEGDADP
jgi:hypothetical protein